MYSIEYEVSLAKPAAHLFHVRCLIHKPDPGGQVLSLPAWIPGSYLIRDFAKNIVSISASCDGESLPLQRLDKESWQCPPCKGTLQLQYEVYAWDPSVRTAQLDHEYGFFNGTSLFLRVHGQEAEPSGLTIQVPADPLLQAWQVFTTMPVVKADKQGFGQYMANDYDELIDHPVAMGEASTATFEAAGVPHTVALFGQHRADLPRICNDLSKICEQHIYFFDEQAPVEHYLFIVRVLGEGYGGLEHRASTVLVSKRDCLPSVNESEISDDYRIFLGLCSHEYFHTWNVKRIKPAAFTPYDLQTENYTELLWAFEGITSYYDDLGLVRSGVITAESYLELLGQMITRVARGKGRLQQNLVESSFYAWTKFYQQDENAANAIVSYYTKGALASLCLDLTIRRHTQNKKSLDDVMQLLWQRHGQTGVGVPEESVEAIASEVAGVDLGDFFAATLRSTAELPLSELLNHAGVDLYWRAAESQKDNGGKPAKQKPGVELGAQYTEVNGALKVQVVTTDTAAQRGGLSAGDIIVACNGLKAKSSTLTAELKSCQPGDTLKLHVFRGDRLLVLDIELLEPELTTCFLQQQKGATTEQQEWFNNWLKLN